MAEISSQSSAPEHCETNVLNSVPLNFSRPLGENIAFFDDEESTLDPRSEESAITENYPEYITTWRLDELRATEYAFLEEQNHVYLDYTGSGLAAAAQHRAHANRLANILCGNPHSLNPTSQIATNMVEYTKERILAHFNASPEEYAVIFTPNATGAARLVGEAYPFSRRNRLVLTTDNHNSIQGLREFARRRHTSTIYVPAEAPELRVDTQKLDSVLRGRSPWASLLGLGPNGRTGLFAYPAQSNFSGVRHPLSWVSLAQEQGYDVLLDVAAYVPTGMLDLSIVQPEFLIMSWYKMFGYPTGVGCLIAKRSALARLSRPWFSGGVVKAVTVATPWHALAEDESAFEDGTLNFLAIPDVAFGLDWLSHIGMDIIARRVRCLTAWFLERLKQLKHSSGRPMVKVYGPTTMEARGGTIVFNILDAMGKVVDERLIASESAVARISLRVGCFCNPGAAEHALDLTAQKLRPLGRAKAASFDEIIDIIGLQSAGAIRVSFGIASNASDVDRFLEFATKTYRNRITTTKDLPPRNGC